MDDPRSFFRIEARELLEGLTQGALHVERTGTLTPAQSKHLLRLAHTLKGAARIVKEPEIAQAAHTIEDLISAAAEAQAPDAELASRLLALLDEASRHLPADPEISTIETTPADAPAPVDEPARMVRIELAAVDGLLERASQISAQCAEVREQIAAVAGQLPPSARHATTGLDALAAAIAQMRDDIRRLRLAPASTLFVTLERAVRDAAQAAGVRARLDASGGEHRLDADVLATVRDALIQMVRNAVAHGIEPPAVRASAGKPVEGRIALAVEQRGAEVAFVLSDDGRGLNVDGLRRAAEASGALAPGQAATLPEDALIRLLLAGGLTSRDSVTQLAGRGVGLDLVRSVATRLNGRVSIVNHPGRGVTVDFVVPVSIRSLTALRVEAVGVSALLPLDAVLGATRLQDATFVDRDGLPHLIVDRREIPFVRLSAVLGGQVRDGAERRSRGVAVLVGSGSPAMALGADGLGDVGSVIVQALPPLSGASALVRGLAVDDRGGIIPVLEPAELTAIARSQPQAWNQAREARTHRVLVVDDSITTRMLEQSILETAGYQVDTAASAEDALTRAALVSYDLFVVDVEMPGMNGYEFLEHARETTGLSGVPAILVTSRSAAADRQRGMDAGAKAYIVKGEFDQELFLATIRRLLD